MLKLETMNEKPETYCHNEFGIYTPIFPETEALTYNILDLNSIPTTLQPQFTRENLKKEK